MPFKRIISKGTGGPRPLYYLTIEKHKQFSFTKEILTKDFRWLELCFDEETRRIGINLYTEQDQVPKGCFKIFGRAGSLAPVIAGGSFIKQYHPVIPQTVTIHPDVEGFDWVSDRIEIETEE